MDNNINQDRSIFNLTIEGDAKQQLQIAASWARIMAIVGFVTAGIAILSTAFSGQATGGFALAGGLIGTILVQVVGVVLNIFLYRFAKHTLESLTNASQVQFNEGVGNLKTYFKLMSILIIIGMALFIIAVMAFAMGAALLR